MIVIQQPTVKGSLPQPPGPSFSSPKGIRTIDALPGSLLFAQKQQRQDEGTLHAPPPSKTLGSRKRNMARSASMFQTNVGKVDSVLSSRSTSPLTSISSATDSNSIATPFTSVSTISVSGASRRRKAAFTAAERRQVPFGDVKGTSMNEDPAALSYDVPVDVAIPQFARPSINAQRDLARVWEAVAGARRIAVICGAGISVSSPANIPDFRSAGGLFRKLKEKHPNVGLQSGKDLFDASLFNSSTTSACFYSMVSELKAMADAASPTTFHHLLKRLDMEGRLMRVYTQNIDGLEEKAGLTFGLGEAGDSRSTLRALGKRKREAAAQRKAGLTRSKSAPSAMLGRHDDEHLHEPMFPRAIPLHGSLSTMTCQVCGHKVYLTLASPGPQRLPARVRELSPDASDEAVNALDLLSQGEAVTCKRCEQAEQVRAVANLRSRGIGMMKVDVVLYNGQNDGAERVGDCVERDILGLRDPNETAVPENNRERLLRERKERKEELKRAASQTQEDSAPITVAKSTDDALGDAFEQDDDPDAKAAEQELCFDSQAACSTASQRALDKPKRQVRMKPLPPDLLIVAGTSLKVPGTKRLVREFAKACQARDYREYESSDDEDGETSDRSRGSTPRTTRSKVKKEETLANEADEKDNDEEEEDDINAPIRTILLNYDFPLPHTQWEDVFDVWVQGDVQQAALGLWDSTTYPADQVVNDFHMRSDEHHELPQQGLTWSALQTSLEEERKARKKSLSVAAKKANGAGEGLSSSQTSKKTSDEQSGAQKGSKKTSQRDATSTKAKMGKSTSSSPLKKKARKAAADDSIIPPPPPSAGVKKFMKGSTKASFSRVQSAPAVSTAKARKAAS